MREFYATYRERIASEGSRVNTGARGTRKVSEKEAKNNVISPLDCSYPKKLGTRNHSYLGTEKGHRLWGGLSRGLVQTTPSGLASKTALSLHRATLAGRAASGFRGGRGILGHRRLQAWERRADQPRSGDRWTLALLYPQGQTKLCALRICSGYWKRWLREFSSGVGGEF